MIIVRQKPETNDQRNSFLNDNKVRKNTALVVDIYSTATSTTLDTMASNYATEVTLLNNLAAPKVQANVNQNYFEEVARNSASQFYQVFNFGVKRFISPTFLTTLYRASDRAYYGQPVSNGNVPRLDSLTKVKTFLLQIINGDANRVTAGGAAMANPSKADIVSINTALLLKIALANSAEQAYIDQLIVVAALNVDADILIERMMSEGETYYVGVADATKRNYLKLWGYKYYSIGSGADITFTVLDSITLLPVDEATAQIDANGDKGTGGADGIIVLSTTIIDAAVANIEAPLYNSLAFPLVIIDKSVSAYTIHLVKILPI